MLITTAYQRQSAMPPQTEDQSTAGRGPQRECSDTRGPQTEAAKPGRIVAEAGRRDDVGQVRKSDVTDKVWFEPREPGGDNSITSFRWLDDFGWEPVSFGHNTGRVCLSPEH